MMLLDGRPVAADQLAALALTPYGHFTTMRTEDGRTVRGLAHHLERLRRDCAQLFGTELDTGLVRRQLAAALAGQRAPLVVRVTVYDPGFDLGHPAATGDPHLLISTRAAGPTALPPLRVRSVGYQREDPGTKHVGLYGALRLRRAVQREGWDDALFTTEDGLVSEGATWNIGFVCGGRLVLPCGRLLAGVTMRLLRELHPDHDTVPVRLDRLEGFEAAFATNTAIGVRPVTAVDDHAFPAAHPLLDRLREEYWALPGEPLDPAAG
ncbi:aminotransferase class IV [Kitasatospora sp. NPDC006697]|uniref:aminotransferase class IV n=1 Tax=Kitasatospora sp. NPDC006697 TaxID=3364020 RepID=UPI003677E1B3